MVVLLIELNLTSLMRNKLFTGELTVPTLFICLLSIFVLIFSAAINFNKDYVTFLEINSLNILSLTLFIIVCACSILSDKNFIFLLPVQLLAMPAPVDDFFISVLLTQVQDIKQVYFPIITHIDIYLALGIFRKITLTKPRILKGDFLIPAFLLLMFIVLISNLILSVDYWDFYLLLAHTYHFRYLVLLLILSFYYDFSKHENPIIYGIILSIILLFFESVINTLMIDGDRLVSGTLGNNSYANIIGSIIFFFVWLNKYNKMPRKVTYPIIILSFLIIISTQTRMALIAPSFVLLVYFIYNLRKNFIVRLVKLISLITLCLFSYLYLVKNNYIPKRYSVEQLIGSNRGGFILKTNSESSSLLTRFRLFNTSVNMIKENPIDGIGVGRFNRYKKAYGFRENVLIDSHNDLLALACQYGIFIGFLFLFCMTLLPLYYYIYFLKNKTDNKLAYLFIINFTMLFSGITNAGLMKHQIFAFLAFNLIVLNSIVKLNHIKYLDK